MFFVFFLRCCYEFPKRDEVEGAWILLWSLTGSQRMCFICLFFLVVTLISLPTMMRMPQQTEQTSLAGSIFPYFLTHLSAAISVGPKLPWKANPSQHSKCYVAALTSTVSNWLLLSFPFISKLVPNHSVTQVWQFPWFWFLLFLSSWPFFFSLHKFDFNPLRESSEHILHFSTDPICHGSQCARKSVVPPHTQIHNVCYLISNNSSVLAHLWRCKM